TLLRQAYANSDHVVFPAQVVKDRISEAFSLEPSSSAVHAQGLVQANPFVNERQYAKLQVEKSLRLPGGRPLVVGCGFASHRKGVDLFVKLARLIPQQWPDRETHFVWIGERDGDFTNECMRDIASLGVAHRLHLTGPLRCPGLYYAAADVFVLPSREDPF